MREGQNQPEGVRTIVWTAMLATQLLLGLVIWFVSRGWDQPGELPAPVAAVLGFMALSVWLLALAWPRYLMTPENILKARPELRPDEIAQRRSGILVVCWSLAEAGTLMGFVMAFISRSPLIFAPFLAAGVAVHGLSHPALFRNGDRR